MTAKELRRKQAKDKALVEDILFIIGIFVLLVIWGQYCLSRGWVIWLDQEVSIFIPRNKLEHFIVRAFYPYFDPDGVLPLNNSIFASAYNQYVHDFYNALDYDVIEIYMEEFHLYVDYFNNNAECYDGDYAPMWSPEECIYYTLMDMGMNETAK